MTRRHFLRSATLAAAASPLVTQVARAQAASGGKLKGNIHQSVCRWCYDKIKLDDLCAAAKGMGLVAVDLLNPDEFATVKKHGLDCSMVNNPTIDGLGGITKAFNRREHHDKLALAYEQRLKETADAGYQRLICFAGNREGLDDAVGLANCETGLKRILPVAEKLQVTLCMELLNSKRNHKDYQCDHVAWGAELVRRISSERFKLLYDIYHMQIMEGDLIQTIRDNIRWIGHFHTGGVPGRHELNDQQEVQWDGVMRAIAELDFKDYVAHEFEPKGDPFAGLRQAADLCDV